MSRALLNGHNLDLTSDFNKDYTLILELCFKY